MTRHGLVILAAAAMPMAAEAAVQLTCHEERGTMKNMCISESEVRVNGDIRSSPLYQGGPSGVNKTPYFVLTDCARRVSTLQDRQGVNFAGGSSSATPAMRDLSQWICDAPKPRKDTKLRQF